MIEQVFFPIAIVLCNFQYLSVLDINECGSGSSCHANAFCTNTEGSYNCQCVDGYRGNGMVCKGMIIIYKLRIG